MSTTLCPVDMRWNGKEHFVIPNQELHEEGRRLMEVKNEKRRPLPREIWGGSHGRPVTQKNLICQWDENGILSRRSSCFFFLFFFFYWQLLKCPAWHWSRRMERNVSIFHSALNHCHLFPHPGSWFLWKGSYLVSVQALCSIRHALAVPAPHPQQLMLE